MKKGPFVPALLFLALFFMPLPAKPESCYTIRLIHKYTAPYKVDRYWEEDDLIKFDTNGGTIGIHKSLIKSIEKNKEKKINFQIKTPPTTDAPILRDKLDAPIICDKFKIITTIEEAALELSLETDLPDNTVVFVHVTRFYFEKNSKAEYPLDYFSEKSIIGKWRSKQKVFIEGEKWKSLLMERQKEMSKLEFGFEVTSISDMLKVSMVVPVNQPDPRFGERNAHLSGKAVKNNDLRVVKDEVEIYYPLVAPP